MKGKNVKKMYRILSNFPQCSNFGEIHAWTAGSTKRCKQVEMRRLLVEMRVTQRKGGFVAVRQRDGRDASTFSRGKMARKKEWTRPRTRW